MLAFLHTVCDSDNRPRYHREAWNERRSRQPFRLEERRSLSAGCFPTLASAPSEGSTQNRVHRGN